MYIPAKIGLAYLIVVPVTVKTPYILAWFSKVQVFVETIGIQQWLKYMYMYNISTNTYM